MKSKKAETGIQKWERIKEGMKEYTRLSWQRNGHLRIDLNSVGPDSKELSIEERRHILWNVLKDNYHENKVEVKSPNGDKTYLKRYGDKPFNGILYFLYSYGEAIISVFFWVGPRISLLHVHSTDTGVDYEEMRELVNDSLNKMLAKYSLSVSLSEEMSEEDIDAYLDFMHGPVLPNIFID